MFGRKLISIETVKVASSQHRFYFDVHKVCGKLGQGKFALGLVVNTIFFGEYGLDMSTSITVCMK